MKDGNDDSEKATSRDLMRGSSAIFAAQREASLVDASPDWTERRQCNTTYPHRSATCMLYITLHCPNPSPPNWRY